MQSPLPRRVVRAASLIAAPSIAALALSLVLAPAARADEPWPTRPITIVVPFGPGSGSDVGARMLAKDLTEAFGQSIVVDNRPGANGTIGSQIVARAKPDGYTLLFGSATTNATNYAFFPGKLPYAQGDFDIITPTGGLPQVLWIAETNPAKNLSDVIAQGRRDAGRNSCGAGNAVTQVACEILKKQGSFDMSTVTYKSNAQAIADVATGQITMAFSDVTAALPYVEQKKVRAIAVAGTQRNPVLPGVATFPEQGYPDIQMTAWSAIFAPHGTPPSVLEKLSAAIKRSNATEAATELRKRSGSNDLWMPLSDARKFLAAEIAKWERYVRDSGVKPE